MWKANNMEKFPIKVTKKTTATNARVTRGDSSERLVEFGMTELVRNTCIGDATRLWNKVPPQIKTANTIFAAKKEIKKFVASLPI